MQLKNALVMVILGELAMSPLIGADRKKLGDLPTNETKKDNAFGEKQNEKPLEDDVADELYEKGVQSMEAGKLDQAENFFDRVLVLKPNHKEAQEKMVELMRMIEDKPEPVPSPSVDPKETLIQKLTKNLDKEFNRGNWDEAHAIAQKIMAIDPDNKTAKSKLGSLRKKLHAQAVERAKQREAKDDSAGAIDAYRMAQVYWNDPTIPERINMLRKKIRDEKVKKSESLYLDALVASQKGNIDRALALCTEALALDPDNSQAKRMMERLQPKSAH